HVVQSVMQAGGDQQTVQEGVQANTDHVQALDEVTNGNQSTEDHRPYEQQDSGQDDCHHTGNNGHGTLAGEEGQELRQLGALELVVAQSAHNAGQDADEGVGDLGESNLVGL